MNMPLLNSGRVERRALCQLEQHHSCPSHPLRPRRLGPRRDRSQRPRRSDLLVAHATALAVQDTSPSRSPSRTSNSSSSSPPRSPSRPQTSPHEVVLSFFAALNSRDIGALLHTLADDVVLQDLAHEQPATNKLDVARFYLDLFSSLAGNMKFVVEDVTGGDSSSVGVMWHIAVEGRELPLSRGLGFYRLNAQRRICFVRQSPEHFVKVANLALSATGMASPLVSVLGPAATPSFWSSMIDTAWALSASPAAGGVQQLLGSVDSTLSSLFSGAGAASSQLPTLPSLSPGVGDTPVTRNQVPGGDAQRAASSQLPSTTPLSPQLPASRPASSALPTSRSASSQLPASGPASSQPPSTRPASSQPPSSGTRASPAASAPPAATPRHQHSQSTRDSSSSSSSSAAATSHAQGGQTGGPSSPPGAAPLQPHSSKTGSSPSSPNSSSGTSTSLPAPVPASIAAPPTPVSAQLLAAALSAAAAAGNAAATETETGPETTRQVHAVHGLGSVAAASPAACAALGPAAGLEVAGQLPPEEPLDLSGIWSKVPELSQPEQYERALDLWQIHGLQRATARLIEGLQIQQRGRRFEVHHLTLIPHFKVTESFDLEQQCKVMRRDLRPGQATANACPLPNGRGVALDIAFGAPLAGQLQERYENPESGVLHVTSTLHLDGQAVQAVQVYRLQRDMTKQQFIQQSERRNGSAAEVLRRAGAPA